MDDQLSAPLAKLQGAFQRVAKDDGVKSFQKDWTEAGRAVEKIGVPGPTGGGGRGGSAPALGGTLPQFPGNAGIGGGGRRSGGNTRSTCSGEGGASELRAKALVAR
ncbi:hypothetical protein QA634_34050 [Methylobacterium sp. CB376]|uniref:hypothetical protein n=1 Tax=unclassified Methylobacterium TaxID=2615210 RepID=UPI00143BBF96|nr:MULTISPECIES: hypothetical protein [Methylobacterium]WFT80144.1 hypothetical protein QA634_34050 [Methylobacterium nodulans]